MKPIQRKTFHSFVGFFPSKKKYPKCVVDQRFTKCGIQSLLCTGAYFRNQFLTSKY